MSELDETTALSSRNFHINQLSKLPKHIPQVLVAYSWVQTSNKYLPTQSLPSACHQQIRSFLQIVHSYVWLLLVKGLTTNCTYRTPMTKLDSLRHHKLANLPAFPQPCQHLKSPCHRSNNCSTAPPQRSHQNTKPPNKRLRQLTVVLFGSLSVGNDCGDGAGAPYAV